MLNLPFADVSDLESQWRPLSDSEQERARTLLLRASAQILARDRRGVLDALMEPSQILVKVTCAMVQRAMASGVAVAAPVTQQTQTFGPFSQSATYANPNGDVYLTTAEVKDLGLARQRAGGIDMWAGAYETGS